MKMSTPMSKTTDLVSRFLLQSGAENHEDRHATYQHMRQHIRSSLERQGMPDDEIETCHQMTNLNAAIEQIEKEYIGHVTEVSFKPDAVPDTVTPVPVPVTLSEKPTKFWQITAMVLSACLVAALAIPLMFDRKPVDSSGLAVSIAEARSGFSQNIKLIDAIATAINADRLKTGAYPVTGGTFILWGKYVEKNPQFVAVSPGSLGQGSFIIQASERDFKILAVQTGDCIAALLDQPAAVDPVRTGSRLDCVYYGRWSEGAKSW